MDKLFFTLFLVMMSLGCSKESYVNCEDNSNSELKYCVDQDLDEKSVILLNEEKYDEVITLLEAEIENATQPKYERYVRIAAAYGGKANCSFFSLISVVTESGDGESNLDCESISYSLDNLSNEISKIEYLSISLDYLSQIPDEILSPEEGETEDFYVNNAKLFSALFKPIHATKCLKLFDFIYQDPSYGSHLTEEVVTRTSCSPQGIVNNLVSAAQDLLASLGCGDLVSQEICDAQEDLIIEQANTIGDQALGGDSDNLISNIMVAKCKENDPEAECPVYDLGF